MAALAWPPRPPPIRISQSAASRRVAQELPRSRSRTVINPACLRGRIESRPPEFAKNVEPEFDSDLFGEGRVGEISLSSGRDGKRSGT